MEAKEAAFGAHTALTLVEYASPVVPGGSPDKGMRPWFSVNDY